MSRGSKVTMQQIADRLQVSKYTVSQALSGKSGVSELTRQRVMETARSMGYLAPPPRSAGGGGSSTSARSAHGQNLDSQSRYVVIWMSRIHLNEPMYWQRVLAGIQESCGRRGWETVVLSPYR